MRVLTTELKKLFSSRIFLLIAVSAFVLNAYLMFRTANSGDARPENYKAVYAELEDLSDPEKLQWLDDRLGEYQGQHSFNWTVLHELRDEAANITGYPDFLASIDSQARSMIRISIFAKPNTFNYRSIMKTPPAYKNVQDVQPVFDISKGIILATDNSFTDILCGFIVLFAVLTVMLSDREQGMSGLLFSLKRGRGYLLFSKLTALAVTVFAAVLLIYTENLIIAGNIYGLGDLSRPVQSLSGFIGCNLKINVIQYLILYILFKFTALFGISSILSLIAVNTRNTISFYSISAAVAITEGMLYKVIHPLSIYSIFRYINIISLTKVNEIFCNYKNINFWEYPIPLIPVSLTALIAIAALCSLLSAYLYAKKRNLEFRKIGLKFKIGKGNKIHSPLWYTFYKSLIHQKGAVIIVLFIAVSAFLSQGFIKKYDTADVYYQHYTKLSEGAVSDETIDFFDEENARFSGLQNRMNELMQSEDQNSSRQELESISRQLAPSMGFYPAYERLQKIKNTDNAYMFYDTGYKRAFGKKGYNDDMKYALAAVLLCLFLISPLIANDNKYSMSFVINSTRSGKQSYIRRNIFAASIYGIFASLLWCINYWASIFQYYDRRGLSGSVRSIIGFTDFPINMKLWQYILMIIILRTIFVVCSALTMLWISAKCRNVTSAVLINFAVFALPIIIYLMGAKIMVNIGFNPLISVNALINDFSALHLSVPIIMLIIMIYSRLKDNYKGKRHMAGSCDAAC